jgi:hypothetical protein
MHTSTISNWRPLSRALYALLIAIAAVWEMPRNARAQLYVSQLVPGTVGTYNAKTGVAINASFITGLSWPVCLALRGNQLFVAWGRMDMHSA